MTKQSTKLTPEVRHVYFYLYILDLLTDIIVRPRVFTTLNECTVGHKPDCALYHCAWLFIQALLCGVRAMKCQSYTNR